MVFQDVTRNNKLTPAAKGLYAYLASFCGDKDECFPSVDLILREMGMGKDTFYRHINALVAAGVVEKRQSEGENGKFGRTVYSLTHEVVIHDFPYTQNEDTDKRYTGHKETNNNSINNNNINNNNKRGNRRFTPPTLEEVKTYCQERNNQVDPERFFDFYSAKGWMIGKNKMKDWKAAVRTWERKDATRQRESVELSPEERQRRREEERRKEEQEQREWEEAYHKRQEERAKLPYDPNMPFR